MSKSQDITSHECHGTKKYVKNFKKIIKSIGTVGYKRFEERRELLRNIYLLLRHHFNF